MSDSKRSTFTDKMPIVRNYIVDLVQLNLMRYQIPGNEMSDQRRLALALFAQCEKETKAEILGSLVGDIDAIIMDRLCDIMVERAPQFARPRSM